MLAFWFTDPMLKHKSVFSVTEWGLIHLQILQPYTVGKAGQHLCFQGLQKPNGENHTQHHQKGGKLFAIFIINSLLFKAVLVLTVQTYQWILLCLCSPRTLVGGDFLLQIQLHGTIDEARTHLIWNCVQGLARSLLEEPKVIFTHLHKAGVMFSGLYRLQWIKVSHLLGRRVS